MLKYFYALPFLITFCLGASFASACDLDGFDQAKPPSERAQTPETKKTHFEWGSDTDPWSDSVDGEQSWHYVKNTHKDGLSLNWAKVGLVIPFDAPIYTDDCRSVIEYGNEKAFRIDFDAPITTSNDGEKAAVAFVRTQSSSAETTPRITGSQIRADYRLEGETSTATVRLIANFYPDDRVMKVNIYSGEGGESLAFQPRALGLDIENVAAQLAELGIGIIKIGFLSDFYPNDEDFVQSSEVLGAGRYIQISTRSSVILSSAKLSPVSGDQTKLLAFSPQGSLLAIKTISLVPFSK